MRRIKLILAIAVLSLVSTLQAQTEKFDYPTESLNYEIVYHWGIIWKHAASATLSAMSDGDNYNTKLAARTVSWADKVYPVRDTLYCTIKKSTFQPLRYVKSAHEDDKYSRDIINYSYKGDSTFAHTLRYRPNKAVAESTLQNQGPAYDILSVFYFLRTLDYANLSKNKVYQTTIFSGSKKEKLNIRYLGIEDIKLRDKSTHKAYHIVFTFTQDGQKKSSEDINTWISADNRHIPLMFVGKLPIGEVRGFYAK